MSDLVLDASLALQWFLEDEANRGYSLKILSSLSSRRAVVPALWFYEVGNGLLMAHRRKRITVDQIQGYLARLKGLPIAVSPIHVNQAADLPLMALKYGLTNYDAAYLDLALRLSIPLATLDTDLIRAASAAGVAIVPA